MCLLVVLLVCTYVCINIMYIMCIYRYVYSCICMYSMCMYIHVYVWICLCMLKRAHWCSVGRRSPLKGKYLYLSDEMYHLPEAGK